MYSIYVYVFKENREKFDDWSKKYVFIGYDGNFKGYKLYDPKNNKFLVNRDMDFDEEISWIWIF